MPTFSKVSHISFSVTDAEASARWWANLLDLTELDRVGGDGWRAILLIHPPSRTIVEFQQHDANQGEAFDPTPANVESRIQRVTLPNGLKLVMLPKKNGNGKISN